MIRLHLRTSTPSRGAARLQSLAPILVAAGCALLLATGCATTAPADRARLGADAMRFDPDEGLQYLRLKMEAAREGSLGGYGDATAGSCGCQ